jgi:hypothetical protein
MAAVTFDTLKFVEKLRAAGVNESHAETEAEALVSAFSDKSQVYWPYFPPEYGTDDHSITW